ncbi:MAG: SAP domain-containing protein [Candidatus Thermoplasmatota archaeon]|nr:SAP domain-containing protein [Candidatus Thermoplasmatota archaeon]
MKSEQEPQAPAETEGKSPSDDSESSAETAQEYSDLKVDDLKKKLKELDLPVSGRKSELIERLIASSQEVKEEESGKVEFVSIEGLSRSELRKLRKKYHLLAEEIRVKRDELNLKSQTHASERNELNQKAKEHMDNVHLYRDRRNGLNVEVGQIRDERRDLSNNVKVLKDNFLRLKRTRFSGRNLPPISRLRKQIQELEIKQMTTPLTRDKERALVEEIGSLQNKIKEHDELIETDAEVLEARDEFREAETNRRDLSKKMQKSRQEAQACHNQMKDSLRLNRSTRRKADSAQRMFVKAKEKADEVHNEYIEYLRAMQEIDRTTASHTKSGSVADQEASAASAEDLFAKFLAGEKLSTEQLMIIQKAGML